MAVGAATKSAWESGLLSLRPWALGIAAGVVTLALGTGVSDDKGFVHAIAGHWIIWSASSFATLIVGGGARVAQKYGYNKAVETGTATSGTTTAFLTPSQTKVIGTIPATTEPATQPASEGTKP
jgi:hypothetical protein